MILLNKLLNKKVNNILPNPYHKPNFYEEISHSWTPRKLLGLPEVFTPMVHEEEIKIAINKIKFLSKNKLIRIIQNKKTCIYRRIAAGRLLALYGDQRIDNLSPKMIYIHSESPTLGLNINSVPEIQKEFSSFGVLSPWIEKECPEYQVKLNSYYIGKYLVTNSEYAVFLEETNHLDIPSSWVFGRFPTEKSNHPVYTISPESADAYAIWLSRKTKRKFRLPTEAEWEYAAAGPYRNEYPWGNYFKSENANTAELGLLDTTPVGIFPQGDSFFGVSDMAGNVEEYVKNTYQPYPGGKLIEDDLFKINPNYRIARGGSFTRFQDLARTKRRHGWNPESPIYVMGFRLVEEI